MLQLHEVEFLFFFVENQIPGLVQVRVLHSRGIPAFIHLNLALPNLPCRIKPFRIIKQCFMVSRIPDLLPIIIILMLNLATSSRRRQHSELPLDRIINRLTFHFQLQAFIDTAISQTNLILLQDPPGRCRPSRRLLPHKLHKFFLILDFDVSGHLLLTPFSLRLNSLFN